MMWDFVVDIVPADGFALLSVGTSADTVLTKFSSWMCMGPEHTGLTLYMLIFSKKQKHVFTIYIISAQWVDRQLKYFLM